MKTPIFPTHREAVIEETATRIILRSKSAAADLGALGIPIPNNNVVATVIHNVTHSC